MAVRATLTLTTRLPAHEVRRRLMALPSAASGTSAGASTLLVRVGLAALQTIKDAYVVKARGETDRAGLRWEPLAPYTVKLRAKPSHRRLARGKGRGRTEILRETGDLIASLTPGARPDDAPPSPPPMPGQVFALLPGEVVVGTALPYAHFHHEGTATIPQRRLWAGFSRWPSSWKRGILHQAALGACTLAEELL